jgi:hypothetical protein
MRTPVIAIVFLAACHHDPAPAPPRSEPPPASESSAPTAGSAAMSSSEDPGVTKLREFRDRACACKDKHCVDTVQQDLIAYASNDKSTTKPSKADEKAADEIMKKFEDCVVAAGGKL